MTDIRVFEVLGTAHRLIIDKASRLTTILIVLVIALALLFTATDLEWVSRTTAWAPNTIAAAFLAYYWHRTILLDSKDHNTIYANDFLQGFITRYFVVSALVLIPFIAGLFLFFSKTALGIVLGALCFLAAVYLPLRVICCLPAKAIGGDESIADIWRGSGEIIWKLIFAFGLVVLLVSLASIVFSIVMFLFFETTDDGFFQNPIVTLFSNLVIAVINVYSGLWMVGIASITYQRTFVGESGGEATSQAVEV